jgi:hypothetical protein
MLVKKWITFGQRASFTLKESILSETGSFRADIMEMVNSTTSYAGSTTGKDGDDDWSKKGKKKK